MSRRSFIFGLIAACVPQVARAEHYLDPEEAARLIFPEADTFAPAPAELDRETAREIQTRSGVSVRDRNIDSLEARQSDRTLGWVYVDSVIGKYEYITYAAGISADGAVCGVEILDYRESYGGAVRDAAWLGQFDGRTLDAPPELGGSIANISGATISSRNVTDGVRRLLATHAALGR